MILCKYIDMKGVYFVGIEVSIILKLGFNCDDYAASWSIIYSNLGRKDLPKWQFWIMTQASSPLYYSILLSAIIPYP